MRQFYGRVWVRDGAIIAVNSNTKPIVRDVVSPDHDQKFDLIVKGAFITARELRPHLSFDGEVKSDGPKIIIQGAAGSLWQQA